MLPAALNPWALLAAGAVWLASLVAVGWWQREDGRAAERAEWRERDNDQIREANRAILRLTENARTAEREHGEAVAAIAGRYEKELYDAQTQRERDRALLRTGGLRLRDPAATGIRACRDPAAAPGAAAGLGNGRAPGQLSDAAAEFLLGLAADADDVARQLAACQRLVIEDRRDHLPDAGKMVE